MFKHFLTLICITAFLLPALDAKLSRKEKRRMRILESLGIESAEGLEQQAIDYIAIGEYKMAIQRYSSLISWHPQYKPERCMQVMAGLYYEMGEPMEALEHAEEFAEKYPDSALITELVQMAFEIGKNLCVAKDREYKVLNRYTKAVRAFEYVNKHDPYSVEAAESLMSQSAIHILRGDWEEALLLLQEIEQKQPGSEIAARAEVVIGRCFLGMNKGGEYSRGNIDQAVRYLESYLQRYPKGLDREEAQSLLIEAYKRRGILQLKIIRYYCTARKWEAAQSYVEELLKNEKLKKAHAEAKELRDFLKKKIKA